MDPSEMDILISTFMEVAAIHSSEVAEHHLQATNWDLESAVQMFLLGMEDTGGSPPFVEENLIANRRGDNERFDDNGHYQDSSFPVDNIIPTGWDDDEGVDCEYEGMDCEYDDETRGEEDDTEYGKEDGERAPLPVIRETLYDRVDYKASAFRANEDTTLSGSPDPLADICPPRLALMYKGSFEEVKMAAAISDKWLLVNLQSREEFDSFRLNRDTWSNDSVAEMIDSGFLLLQEDQHTLEGRKICTFYKLDRLPAILVIDPITGQKMREWVGMVEPQSLLEDLVPYMDSGPKYYITCRRKHPKQTGPIYIVPEKPTEHDTPSVVASTEGTGESSKSTVSNDEIIIGANQMTSSNMKPVYFPLPEEPKGSREIVCRVGVRLPDGRRLQRKFLRADSIKLLWSFCGSQIDECEWRLFYFVVAVPSASRTLMYDSDSDQTFEESGLSDCMVTMVWSGRD